MGNIHTEFDRATALLKLLSLRQRLEILHRLRDGEASVRELSLVTKSRDAATSQQLSLLRQFGVVRARRDGVNMLYSICNADALALLEKVQDIFDLGGLQTPVEASFDLVSKGV